MTIRKGEPWGERAAVPAGTPVFAGDAELRGWVVRHRSQGLAIPPAALDGGDLARTVGGPTSADVDSRAGSLRTRVTVDVVRVVVGTTTTWSVAHVVIGARRRRWPYLVAMNAQFHGRYDLAPRGHPNDGRVDVTVFDRELGWRAVRQVRERARTGSHLPHPHLRTSSPQAAAFDLPGAAPVWIDHARAGRHRRVELTVEPDALVLFV